jgi:LacI family transcriptional regulator
MVYRKQGSGTYLLEDKQQKTKTLGVLLPGEHAGEFFSTILKGIDEISSVGGYHQIVKFSGRSAQYERKCLKEMLKAEIDGIILCFNHSEHSKNNVEFLIKQKVPFVLIDRHFPELQTDYVGFDNFEAGSMATNYCIEHGHRNIVFISIRPTDYSSVTTRLNGYHSAMKNAGLAPNVVKCENGDMLKNEIRALLRMKNRPTAIVTNQLNEIIEVAKEGNIKLPQDISLVKFGHIADPFEFFTYIDTPTEKMAQKATEILIGKITSKIGPEKCRIALKPELIEGNSVVTRKM